jgi:hypothetical protein
MAVCSLQNMNDAATSTGILEHHSLTWRAMRHRT